MIELVNRRGDLLRGQLSADGLAIFGLRSQADGSCDIAFVMTKPEFKGSVFQLFPKPGEAAISVARVQRQQESANSQQRCELARSTVEQACSPAVMSGPTGGSLCASQRALYQSMGCDGGDAASPTAMLTQGLQELQAQQQIQEQQRLAQDRAGQQLVNDNGCTSATQICRQTPSQCEGARQLIVQAGLRCPDFDAVAAQASLSLQQQRNEIHLQAQQQQLEQERARLDAESRRQREELERQQAYRAALAERTRSAGSAPSPQNHPLSPAQAGRFEWKHSERYMQTMSGQNMNYAVYVQNTGTVHIRCGGLVQGQASGAGVPRVAPTNVPVAPGQTQEVAVLQNIVRGSGSYNLNCRSSD